MRSALSLTLALAASSAWADAPRVVVDIAPIHSLVAQVMQGVGEPVLLVDPRQSPHGYALKPSQARAMQEAGALFVTSFGLTPWLEGPVESLGAQARVTQMMEIPGTHQLDWREGVHEHHDDHDEHDDHKEGHEDHEEGHEDHKEGHDDHDDHAKHEGHEDHEDHKEGHDDHDDHKDGHHDHDHGDLAYDPHGWLDPVNAKLWLGEIAKTLGELDPENAASYTANAGKAQADVHALQAEISASLEGLHTSPFMTLHDGFQYFDTRFDLTYAGSIMLGDASTPSPAQVAAAQDVLTDKKVACIFSEPQQSDKLIVTISEGLPIGHGILDATGAGLDVGPSLYGDLLRALASSMRSCLHKG